MRIIREGYTKTPYELIQGKANKGCEFCPTCGERGMQLLCYSVRERFFKKPVRSDCYRCNNCGAVWESDEYPAWE
jgi:uncharacterized Zn finger protein